MGRSGWKKLNRADSKFPFQEYFKKILLILLPAGCVLLALPETATTNEIKEASAIRRIRGEEFTLPGKFENGETAYFRENDKPLSIKDRLSDRQIEQNILKEIKNNPFIESKDIIVIVKNGEATLEGTVSSLTEHAAATADVFQGGARKVNNRLKVRDSPV